MEENIKKILQNLENRYTVEYPVLKNATYKSLVNYATDLQTPIQRWYRYKEGYSLKLVDELIKKNGVKKSDVLLDPFCGSGSTLVQAKAKGISSNGFETNPFSAFLAKVKVQNYSDKDLSEFKAQNKKLTTYKSSAKVKKPTLSIIDKLFTKEVLGYLLNFKFAIRKIRSDKVRDLFFLAWLSILEEASNYRKAGNGLKVRKGKKQQSRDLSYVQSILKTRLNEIESDLPYAISISKHMVEPKIYKNTSLEMEKFVKQNSIKGVIFSPPYANCFDYTEIYKVELWLGDFVKDYGDLKGLRNKSIRSHLNGYRVENSSRVNSVKELSSIVALLNNAKLWDRRIPMMIQAYFNDMFSSLDNIYKSLKRDGFCTIVVSNSVYGGIVVPTDLLLTRYGESIGFKPRKIEVARFIIPSSQQYNKTRQYKNFIRESIIHLEKI